MLDDLDGVIAALADGFDGALGLEGIVSFGFAVGFGDGGGKKMTHGGDLGLEELRLQERVVAED